MTVIAETHRPEVVLLPATGTRTTTAAAELVLSAGVALATVIASVVQGLNGEFRIRAWGRSLAIRPREGCAYQRSPETAFALVLVLGRVLIFAGIQLGLRSFGAGGRLRLARRGHHHRFGIGNLRRCGRRGRGRHRSVHALQDLIEERRRLRLAARRRHSAFLVFVFRVADSATRPLNLIVDHRDNRVIGDAALARTIIIQHVAGPIPAVLHATPPKTESASRQAASVLVYLLLRTVIQRPPAWCLTRSRRVCECGKRLWADRPMAQGKAEYIRRPCPGQANPEAP